MQTAMLEPLSFAALFDPTVARAAPAARLTVTAVRASIPPSSRTTMKSIAQPRPKTNCRKSWPQPAVSLNNPTATTICKP